MNKSHKKKNKFQDIPEPINICSKCLGDNHDRKYCDIYHIYINNYDLYLGSVNYIQDEEAFCSKIIESIQFQTTLQNIESVPISEAIIYLMAIDHFPDEIKQPLWNIVNKRFSKEEIQDYINLYYE
jgi:hypothetical protein